MNTASRWTNSVSRSSCIDCTDRNARCHAECEKYKAWKAEIDKAREEINKKRKTEDIAIEHTVTAIEKQKKRK